MEKKNYVVAVDFGSSNLIMAVGTKDEADGLMKIEALVSRQSAGIEKGVIQNVNDVSAVLSSVKADIEAELGIRIEEAYAGVSGDFIRYERYSDHVFVSDRKNNIVSQADVDSLHNRMNEVVVPEDDEVLDRYPLDYVIDYKRETENPVGAFSRQLSSTFAFIISKKQPLSRLEMVFRNSGLRLAGIFANSHINAEAVLNADERNDGAAVIDIGGGTTDITVCCGNQVRYVATIPIGGNEINSDINKYGVPTRNIEALKTQHGAAVAENVPENKGLKIRVLGNSFKTVMKRNLASIIEARLTDIADFVKDELKLSGYDARLPFGLVLTGGTASIPDIDRLFSRLTGREVRIATASEGIDEASRQKIDSPEFTSAIAILLAGAAKGGCDTTAVEPTVVPTPSEPVKPQTSKAYTYTPPQPQKPKGIYTPPQTAKTQPAAEEPKAAVKPEKTEPETVKMPPVAEEPVADEPKEKGAKPKRDGFIDWALGKLNEAFINGDDEYPDTRLDSYAPHNIDVSPRPRPSSGKPRINPKKDFGSDFFVDGEDKEEL